jgi:hypothetical protein
MGAPVDEEEGCAPSGRVEGIRDATDTFISRARASQTKGFV